MPSQPPSDDGVVDEESEQPLAWYAPGLYRRVLHNRIYRPAPRDRAAERRSRRRRTLRVCAAAGVVSAALALPAVAYAGWLPVVGVGGPSAPAGTSAAAGGNPASAPVAPTCIPAPVAVRRPCEP